MWIAFLSIHVALTHGSTRMMVSVGGSTTSLSSTDNGITLTGGTPLEDGCNVMLFVFEEDDVAGFQSYCLPTPPVPSQLIGVGASFFMGNLFIHHEYNLMQFDTGTCSWIDSLDSPNTNYEYHSVLFPANPRINPDQGCPSLFISTNNINKAGFFTQAASGVVPAESTCQDWGDFMTYAGTSWVQYAGIDPDGKLFATDGYGNWYFQPGSNYDASLTNQQLEYGSSIGFVTSTTCADEILIYSTSGVSDLQFVYPDSCPEAADTTKSVSSVFPRKFHSLVPINSTHHIVFGGGPAYELHYVGEEFIQTLIPNMPILYGAGVAIADNSRPLPGDYAYFSTTKLDITPYINCATPTVTTTTTPPATSHCEPTMSQITGSGSCTGNCTYNDGHYYQCDGMGSCAVESYGNLVYVGQYTVDAVIDLCNLSATINVTLFQNPIYNLGKISTAVSPESSACTGGSPTTRITLFYNVTINDPLSKIVVLTNQTAFYIESFIFSHLGCTTYYNEGHEPVSPENKLDFLQSCTPENLQAPFDLDIMSAHFTPEDGRPGYIIGSDYAAGKATMIAPVTALYRIYMTWYASSTERFYTRIDAPGELTNYIYDRDIVYRDYVDAATGIIYQYISTKFLTEGSELVMYIGVTDQPVSIGKIRVAPVCTDLDIITSNTVAQPFTEAVYNDTLCSEVCNVECGENWLECQQGTSVTFNIAGFSKTMYDVYAQVPYSTNPIYNGDIFTAVQTKTYTDEPLPATHYYYTGADSIEEFVNEIWGVFVKVQSRTPIFNNTLMINFTGEAFIAGETTNSTSSVYYVNKVMIMTALFCQAGDNEFVPISEINTWDFWMDGIRINVEAEQFDSTTDNFDTIMQTKVSFLKKFTPATEYAIYLVMPDYLYSMNAERFVGSGIYDPLWVTISDSYQIQQTATVNLWEIEQGDYSYDGFFYKRLILNYYSLSGLIEVGILNTRYGFVISGFFFQTVKCRETIAEPTDPPCYDQTFTATLNNTPIMFTGPEYPVVVDEGGFIVSSESGIVFSIPISQSGYYDIYMELYNPTDTAPTVLSFCDLNNYPISVQRISLSQSLDLDVQNHEIVVPTWISYSPVIKNEKTYALIAKNYYARGFAINVVPYVTGTSNSSIKSFNLVSAFCDNSYMPPFNYTTPCTSPPNSTPTNVSLVELGCFGPGGFDTECISRIPILTDIPLGIIVTLTLEQDTGMCIDVNRNP